MSSPMAKAAPRYVCQSCAAAYPKWSGRCESCGAWNSLAEESDTAAVPGSTPDGSTPDGTAQAGDGAAPTVGLKLGADGQLQPVSQDQIAPGDLVVTAGAQLLRPGQRVRPMNGKAP